MDYRLFGFVLLLMLLSACAKSATQDEGIVEIIQLSEDCASGGEDACCQGQCTAFCEGKGLKYTKNMVNGHSCGCWCD